MSIDPQKVRIEGVYPQAEPDTFMMRVKVPAGVISAEQVRVVAELSRRHARDAVHLTCRCSIELHRLPGAALPEAWRLLQSVGLVNRGACGGAVRGVSCSTSPAPGFPAVQVLAAKLHRHFTANPHFEGLPKKFKIGVDAGYDGARHLIQDMGLVLVADEPEKRYDVWAAGGLGRAPQPAFLLAERLPEERLIPLIETVIRLYRELAPAGKRLKHVIGELGTAEFSRRVDERLPADLVLPLADGFDKALTPPCDPTVVARIFAGELSADAFERLAEVADHHSGGYLVLTADQNIALPVPPGSDAASVRDAIAAAGFPGNDDARVTFRICPGSHECRMGLSPTRDAARAVIGVLPPTGDGPSLAISGCPNSCSQPQLADIGIVTTSLSREEDGSRFPRFTLLHRTDSGAFGRPVADNLSLEALLDAVRQLV